VLVVEDDGDDVEVVDVDEWIACRLKVKMTTKARNSPRDLRARLTD
jgi:hypothetical protein